jgi:hypothetical protein
MPRTFKVIVALPMILAFFGFQPLPAFADKASDEAAIRAAWLTYQGHIIGRKGDAGAALLARPTLKYYADMRRLALSGPYEALAKSSMLTRLTVYMVRHVMITEQLQSMSAQQFVSYLIARGMTGRTPNRARPLTGVKIKEDMADGQIGPGAPPLRFLREDGTWKIDLLSLIRKIEPIMEAQIKKSNIPEAQMVRVMVRNHSTKPVDMEKLKQPMINR